MRTHFANLKRDLDIDTAILDREAITIWLIAFSAQEVQLVLEHPRLGKISYRGAIGFAGSPALIFDQYVGFSIEDLVARYVDRIETELPSIDRPERRVASHRAAEYLLGTRSRLLDRAADIKGRLLSNGFNPRRVSIDLAGIDRIPVVERLVRKCENIAKAEFRMSQISAATLRQLKNAITSLYEASDGAYARRARSLSTLLKQGELAAVRELLIGRGAFPTWLALAQSDDIEFGEAFPLPDDPIDALGTVIGLIDYLAQDED
jgi:hypothetical protein